MNTRLIATGRKYNSFKILIKKRGGKKEKERKKRKRRKEGEHNNLILLLHCSGKSYRISGGTTKCERTFSRFHEVGHGGER